jgi:hypothetical protein
MAVITIYGEQTGDICRELESQIRTSGCTVIYGRPEDLPLTNGKSSAGDVALTADAEGIYPTYLGRGSVLISATRTDQANSLLY